MPTTKKKKKATKHITDPRQKIESGQPWRLHFEVDKEVALKILEEEDSLPGAEYGKIVNKRLKQAYNL